MRSYWVVSLIVLWSSATCQLFLPETDEQLLNDPEFQKLMINYFGCRTWEQDQCLLCSEGYYKNKNGICCEVDANCREFNREEGLCEACYEGYGEVDGKCTELSMLAPQRQGCKHWHEGLCRQCSKGWYFSEGICVQVDDLCSMWEDDGTCLRCYGGYVVEAGTCVRDQALLVHLLDGLCAEWNGDLCMRCAERAYFNQEGLCSTVSDFCHTWDPYDGLCLSCYIGYDLISGICIQREQQQFSDPGCNFWDWHSKTCFQCSPRFYMTPNGCMPVSDYCKNYNDFGQCTSCFEGYKLEDGGCILVEEEVMDIGCQTWDWENQVCLSCSLRWMKTDNGCRPISDYCEKFDQLGRCLECYDGYELVDDECQLSPETFQPTQLGCQSWDWYNQICLACSLRWVMTVNGCAPVSDFCDRYDLFGFCTACYKGYELKNGQCVLSEIMEPLDVGCRTWDWENQVCLSCSERWIKVGQFCKPLSDSCATFDAFGQCIKCYDGYVLEFGECLWQEESSPADVGCQTWDWNNEICLVCSERWIMTVEGCVPVSDACLTHDERGDCTNCYEGYYISDGVCLFVEDHGPEDEGCQTWDWYNQVCLHCSLRWIMTDTGCVPIDDQCQRYDGAGNCLSCYEGYRLEGGSCMVWNPLCQETDADGNCISCYMGYIFINGMCTPLSKLLDYAPYLKNQNC